MQAWREIKREAKKTGDSVWSYVQNGSDPVNVGVLLEDGAAVFGGGVALSCVGRARRLEKRRDSENSIFKFFPKGCARKHDFWKK